MSNEVYFSKLPRGVAIQRGMVMLETYGPDKTVDVHVAEIPQQVLDDISWRAWQRGRCVRCELMERLCRLEGVVREPPPILPDGDEPPILPDVSEEGRHGPCDHG